MQKEFFNGRNAGMNPLDSVRGAIAAGFTLAIVLTLLIAPNAFHELGLARWFHILSGITWIGLLYYFNVVQVPGLAAAAGDKGAPAARASASTSRPGRCCGFAGLRSRPG